MSLWHYTCGHGRQSIGDDGFLLPASIMLARSLRISEDVMPGWRMLWATDLEFPNRDALGLTSRLVRCDRTEHRYRVVDEDRFMRWASHRRSVDPVLREELESVPGVMPMHWWVSLAPARAVYEPVAPHKNSDSAPARGVIPVVD